MRPTLSLEQRLKRSQGRLNRTRNVQARFTPQEEESIHKSAERQGLFFSEWVREALLAKASLEPSLYAIFAELIALRSIVDRFLGPVAVGQKLTVEQAKVAAEEIRLAKHHTAQAALELYRNKIGADL